MSTAHGGKGGAIVLIGLATATLGAPDHVWYAASKAAVEAMAIGAAKEVAKEGLRVNRLRRSIDTEIDEPGRLDRIMPFVPIGRAGTAENEVAEAGPAVHALRRASNMHDAARGGDGSASLR